MFKCHAGLVWWPQQVPEHVDGAGSAEVSQAGTGILCSAPVRQVTTEVTSCAWMLRTKSRLVIKSSEMTLNLKLPWSKFLTLLHCKRVLVQRCAVVKCFMAALEEHGRSEINRMQLRCEVAVWNGCKYISQKKKRTICRHNQRIKVHART